MSSASVSSLARDCLRALEMIPRMSPKTLDGFVLVDAFHSLRRAFATLIGGKYAPEKNRKLSARQSGWLERSRDSLPPFLDLLRTLPKGT